MFKPLVTTCLFAAWLALAPGLARATDFTGTWELDLEASQPMDELLKLRGISWAQRRLARSLSVTLVIAQSTESLSFAALSSITSETVTIFPDDVPVKGRMSRASIAGRRPDVEAWSSNPSRSVALDARAVKRWPASFSG